MNWTAFRYWLCMGGAVFNLFLAYISMKVNGPETGTFLFSSAAFTLGAWLNRGYPTQSPPP